MMRIRTLFAVAGVALLATACDLDLSNPNAPAEDEVLGEAEGIVTLAVGMQGEFAEAIEGFIQAPALVTDEWGTGTQSLLAHQALLTGDNFDPDYAVVEEPWADAYEVVRAANALIANAPTVALPSGVQTGIVALAKTLKAMSLGMAILHYEQIPLQISEAGSPLAPRQEAFDTIISLLQSARTDLSGLSEAELNGFRTRVLPDEFNLVPTIDAMLARYQLFAARERDSQELYQAALQSAQAVPDGASSAVTYETTNPNPIYELSVVARYVFPLRSFVTEAQAGDQRPAYWVDVSTDPFVGNPDSLLLPLAQYDQPTGTFPVFLPDEMLLIRAEAQTRLGNLDAARALVNQVRTQSTNEPVAGLPALPEEALDTEEELLEEIAYNRRYELYLQGLRWEDARTLQPYVDVEPVLQYFPIPTQECRTNDALDC